MAANAAHLTRTLNEKPSIFEVIAQESLQYTVQPALRRVIEFIASLNPRRFMWLVRWFDEIFLFFNSVVQYNYIRNYAASFAEHFYGLRRISLKSQIFNDGLHLPTKEENISFVLLAAFPYIRQKLDQLADQYRLAEADGFSPKGWRGTFRKCVTQFQSTFHLIYEFLSLAQYLAYMSGKSDSPSLPLRLASLTLKYAPNNLDGGERTWTDLWTDIRTGNLKSAGISFEMVGTVLLRSMEFGAFFIQFLKWWEDKGPRMDINTLPIPEVPKLDPRASQFKNVCPICMQSWKNPTVLPVSGYVFCYKCIVKHLDENMFCPVTKYPTNKKDLIRLYLPNSN